MTRAVGALDVQDVWSRSGPQPDGGYVEPTEALAICQGALRGLYRVEQTEGDDFLEGHAPDDLSQAAAFLVERWKRGRGRGKPRGPLDWDSMRAFFHKELPEWKSFLNRVLGSAPKRPARRA